MRGVREVLSFLVTIGMFLVGLSLLVIQYERYQDAYQCLSRMITHPSVESEYKE